MLCKTLTPVLPTSVVQLTFIVTNLPCQDLQDSGICVVGFVFVGFLSHHTGGFQCLLVQSCLFSFTVITCQMFSFRFPSLLISPTRPLPYLQHTHHSIVIINQSKTHRDSSLIVIKFPFIQFISFEQSFTKSIISMNRSLWSKKYIRKSLQDAYHSTMVSHNRITDCGEKQSTTKNTFFHSHSRMENPNCHPPYTKLGLAFFSS